MSLFDILFIYQVNAVDADIGNNAAITYGFVNITSDLISNRFSIHPKTGIITTKADLSDIGKFY